MSELRRLSEGPLSMFDRAALRSASDDRPSPAARAAAQAALGLGAVGAGAVAGGAVAGTAGSAATKVAAGLSLAKRAAIAIVAGVVTTGASLVVFPDASDVDVSAPKPVASVQPARSVVPSTPASSANTEDPPVVRVDTLPTVPSPAVPTARAVAPGRSAPPASRLGDETTALAAVRTKLAAGDTAGAHAALDTYVLEFESGVLAPEAAALRVDTFVAAGDRSQALVAARRYLATYPSGAAATRMRGLVESAERFRDQSGSAAP